jgi:hypothetical protein
MPEQPKAADIFQFKEEECALVRVIVTEYTKKVATAHKNLLEIAASAAEVAVIASRCATIIDMATNNAPDFIVLPPPLRVTLGAACSLHARTLNKIRNKQEDMLVDVDDTDTAVEATRQVTTKIGEQLTLTLDGDEEAE